MEKNPVVKGRVSELDLLRFLAAFSVVLYHYTFRGYAGDDMTIMPYPLLAPICEYGYLGVELFFLISGFVILMTASSGSLKRFTVSRIVRLYPAFWVCCTVTFVATLLIGGERYSATFSQYLINLTMLSGFLHVPPMDGVYWSLFVEIKFYLLVALALLVGLIHRAQGMLVGWLVITVALTVFPISTVLSNRIFMVHYAPFFIAGAMCYLIYSDGLTRARVLTVVMAWVVALYYSLQELPALEQGYQVDFNNYIVSAIISIFFVLIFLVSIGRTAFLGSRDWVAIGALTYPLYLIHQHVGFMIFNLGYPDVSRHLLLLGTIITMVGFSYLVSQKVERRYARSLKSILESAFTSLSKYLVNLRYSTRRRGTTRRRGKDHGRGPDADEYVEVVGDVDTADERGKENG